MELNTNNVGLNFFNTMGIPLVGGRDFTVDDREGTPLVVIVNEEFARRYFGGSAVGKRLRLGSDSPWREIVGVARTARYRDLREQPLPFIYVPLAQDYQANVTLMVRSDGDPSLLVGPWRGAARVLLARAPRDESRSAGGAAVRIGPIGPIRPIKARNYRVREGEL